MCNFSLAGPFCLSTMDFDTSEFYLKAGLNLELDIEDALCFWYHFFEVNSFTEYAFKQIAFNFKAVHRVKYGEMLHC